MRANQDETSATANQAFASSDGQEYTIKAGSLAFFELNMFVKLEQYKDVGSLVKRFNPNVTPSYSLVPKYFYKDESSGNLREIVVYPATTHGDLKELASGMKWKLGDKLTDDTEKKYFDAAKKAGVGQLS